MTRPRQQTPSARTTRRLPHPERNRRLGMLWKFLCEAAFVRGRLREETSRQQYVKQTKINASLDLVFRFHESPEALPHLIPPWEDMKLVESAGSLRPGSPVVLRGSLGIIPIQWVAIHTEYDPPHLFADRQESGPFAYWHHRHRFLDDGQGGTLLRDEIENAVPLGVIGRWLGGWIVRRKLEAMFAYRHEITRRLIESREWTSGVLANQTLRPKGDE